VTLADKIAAILDKHSRTLPNDDIILTTGRNGTPWCGCYEGDLSEDYPKARAEAIQELLALFNEEKLREKENEEEADNYNDSMGVERHDKDCTGCIECCDETWSEPNHKEGK